MELIEYPGAKIVPVRDWSLIDKDGAQANPLLLTRELLGEVEWPTRLRDGELKRKKKKKLFITKQNFQIISVCMRQVGSSSYINVFNDNFSRKYQELSGKMLLALHYLFISASIL